MKGFAEELLYTVAIFLSLFILFLFFTSQQAKEGAEVRKTVENRILTEELSDLSIALFSSKVPSVEKSYTQCLIDGILQGSKEYVYYGDASGGVNLTAVIDQFTAQYAKDRIEIDLAIGENYQFGKAKGKTVYAYEMLIPVPDERVGRLTVYLGE